MTQNGISYVLNASNSCPKPDFICDSHFMRIPVNDNYCEKLLPWLDKSIEFIGKTSLIGKELLKEVFFHTFSVSLLSMQKVWNDDQIAPFPLSCSIDPIF